jgi:2-iminobutanoate/2-iminopropanoate deaminase
MLFNFGLLATLTALASATPLSPASPALTSRNQDITRLGSVGKVLSGGTSFGNLVFVSGQVPLTANNTLVPGGIKNETALCIEKVGAVLKQAGTDWSRVLKVTVLMQGKFTALPKPEASRNLPAMFPDINDFAAMNEVYSAMIPDPKPARSAFEVGNLPVA